MANVVVIVQDDRVRRQIEQYLGQLGMDDLRFATFRNHQEFTALYCRDITQSEEPIEAESKSEDGNDEGADLKLFSDVHLIIYAMDSIGEKSGPWLENLKVNFKKYNHWPENGCRTILLKYEDDGVSKLDVIHPLLDDLIFLPLDRLIFLQKVEILLAIPKVIKPKFLFIQKIKLDIEISKIVKMDRLSDVGLAIRNPLSLKRGLPGHFYIELPGEKNRLEVLGKVFRSEPHPEYPGQFLVYFSFFALKKQDLSLVRQSLSKVQRYQSLYSDDQSMFRFNQDDLFISASETRLIPGVVIDSDEKTGQSIISSITKDMDRLKLSFENSYQLFLHRYLEATGGGDKTPPKATAAEDFYLDSVMLTVEIDGLKCLTVAPPPNQGSLLLGHIASDIFSTPDRWMTLFTDVGSRLMIEESMALLADGKTSERILIMQDSENIRRAVRAQFGHGDAEHLATIHLAPASLSDIVEHAKIAEQVKELDFLILDTAYVPEDPAGWIEGLRSRALQVGLTKKLDQLKFFLTSESDKRAHGAIFNNPDILGYLIKPVDNRKLLFLLSEFLPNKNTLFQFENLGWAQPGLPVHVSKGIQLEALSEFGATLKSKNQLAPGTMIYLRKSIYENAPNQCLAARVYFCEPDPTDKDYFQVSATYFGINDQFLKFARTWIRDNYAQQKSKEGG